MRRTPSEIVYAAGNIVADVLHGPLEVALEGFYGTGWRAHLPRSVRVARGQVQWDAAAVLHTLRHTWRDVFQSGYCEDGKHFAGELIGARNRAAHHHRGEALTADDAARALDTARRLLRCLHVEAEKRLDALVEDVAPARRDVAIPMRRPGRAAAASANTYEARRLTFRAAIIESLREDEAFSVVTPDGTFEMTKAQFYEAFPNVVASRSYAQAGVYHYPAIPAKALPFLRAPEGRPDRAAPGGPNSLS